MPTTGQVPSRSYAPFPDSPPPGAQGHYTRWSLALFTRPTNSVILRALTEESSIIAEAVSKATDTSLFSGNSTSRDWFARRIKYQRANNQKVQYL